MHSLLVLLAHTHIVHVSAKCARSQYIKNKKRDKVPYLLFIKELDTIKVRVFIVRCRLSKLN